LCPGNHESSGKQKTGKTRNGNAHLCTVLVEAAWAPRTPDPGSGHGGAVARVSPGSPNGGAH
jgi:hypothetical protein